MSKQAIYVGTSGPLAYGRTGEAWSNRPQGKRGKHWHFFPDGAEQAIYVDRDEVYIKPRDLRRHCPGPIHLTEEQRLFRQYSVETDIVRHAVHYNKHAEAAGIPKLVVYE